MKKIELAIIGLGTVGSSVLNILRDTKPYIQKEFDTLIHVKAIYVRNINKKRHVSLDGIMVTDNIEKIIDDPEIAICIECMGGNGADSTFDIVSRLIAHKKHIIMSSKKCLSLHRKALIEEIGRYGVELRYDATVGGSIPICKMFSNLSGYDEVVKMYGIVNASTNYLLSLMDEKGMTYNDALAIAKEKGYVENDPSDDFEGWDAYYKLTILLRFGLGLELADGSIISNSRDTVFDIKKKEPEANIKQIFYIEKIADGKIGTYVGPAHISEKSMLHNVDYSNNIICIEHKYGGTKAYYGKGAGGRETASIIVEDLIDILRNNTHPAPLTVKEIAVKTLEEKDIAI